MANNSGTGVLDPEGKAKTLGNNIKDLQAQEIELTHAVTRGELTTDEALIKKQAIQKQINDLTQALSHSTDQQEEAAKRLEEQQKEKEEKEKKHREKEEKKEKKETEKRLREQHEQDEINSHIAETNREEQKDKENTAETTEPPQATTLNPEDAVDTAAAIEQNLTSQTTSSQAAPPPPPVVSSTLRPEDAQDTANAIEKNLGIGQPPPPSQSTAETAPHATPSTPTPPPVKKPSKTVTATKAVGKKGIKTYTGIYKYTPLGFLIGKISPHAKEWETGKKAVSSIQNKIDERRKKNEENAPPPSSGHAETKPKKPSKVLGASKKSASLSFKLYQKLYSFTPLALIFNKTKHLIPQGVTAQAKRFTPKKKIPTAETQQETIKPKTAKEYLRRLNRNTLQKAALKGYNRFALLQKVRDWKIWKTRTWQRGKYIAPVAAAAWDTYKWRKNRGTQGDENTRFVRSDDNNQSSQWQWSRPRENVRNLWNRATPRPSLNKTLGRKLGGRTAQKAASTAGKKAAQQLAKKAATQATLAFIKTPPGWVTVGVVVGVILLVVFVMTVVSLISGSGEGNALGGIAPPGGGGQPPKTANPIPNFTLNKSVSVSELTDVAEITYTLSYTLAPGGAVPIESITIFDTVPANTTIVSGKTTGNPTMSADGTTISWPLSDATNKGLSSFSFTVKPNTTNVNIKNSAWAEAAAVSPTPPAGGTPPGGDIPPNTETCNGTYPAPPQGNFGDPACTFTKDDLYVALKSQDPDNADYWYLKIVPCESGYNPNAYLAASTSGLGAYGLFQMNPAGRGNGEYDAGNVNWPLQISNAINYNKLINGSFAYWACR